MIRAAWLIALLLLPAVSAQSAEPENFILFALPTNLHRECFFPDDEFVLYIDGTKLIDANDKIDPARLPTTELEMAFNGVYRLPRRPEMQAWMFVDRDISHETARFVSHAVRGIANRKQLECDLVAEIQGGDWDELTKRCGGQRGRYHKDDAVTEDGVGDEHIRAYPVKTVISRYRSNASCVVFFPDPIGAQATGELSGDARREIKALIKQLNGELIDRVKLRYEIRLPLEAANGRQVVEQLLKKDGLELARELGFESCSVATSHVRAD